MYTVYYVFKKDKYLRFGQRQWCSSLALKGSIDKDTIFTITNEKKVAIIFVKDFDVFS